jgi:hypothetical protein
MRRIKIYITPAFGKTNFLKGAMKIKEQEIKDLMKRTIQVSLRMPPKNPKRIDRILKLVEKYWKQNPDLRLGQLIGNMSVINDSYFMTDELLEMKLKEVIKEMNKK